MSLKWHGVKIEERMEKDQECKLFQKGMAIIAAHLPIRLPLDLDLGHGLSHLFSQLINLSVLPVEL